MAVDNFTFTLEKVEAATAIAKQRAAAHWRNKVWNLWLNWGESNQAVNPAWVDPVFENEWGYIHNDPDTNPANLMTINAYFCYCWYKYKGYSDITIAALLYSHTVESKITGATWESLSGSNFMHPFSGNAGNWFNDGENPSYTALEHFNPTKSATGYNGEWYLGTSLAPTRYITHADWSDDDGVTIGTATIGTAAAGSYDSVRGMYAGDPNYISHRAVSTSSGVQWYYCWTNSGTKRYLFTKEHFGYGLVQWTDWGELRNLCSYITGQFKSTAESDWIAGYNPLTGNYYTCGPEWWLTTGNQRSPGAFGTYHWQLNLVFQLMVLEFQRQNAMRASPVAHPEYTQPPMSQENGFQWSEGSQGEGRYYGGWSDTYAKGAKWNPATSGGSLYTYNVACSWDEWASGAFLTKAGVNPNLLDEIAQDPDPPYRKVRLAMDIFRRCYLRSSFALPAPDAVTYWIKCTEYWNQVWSIADIPRPREFPWLGFELDYWHIDRDNKRFVALTQGRRKKPHVRTILL